MTNASLFDSRAIVVPVAADSRRTVCHVGLRFLPSNRDTSERDNPASRATVEIVIGRS